LRRRADCAIPGRSYGKDRIDCEGYGLAHGGPAKVDRADLEVGRARGLRGACQQAVEAQRYSHRREAAQRGELEAIRRLTAAWVCGWRNLAKLRWIR